MPAPSRAAEQITVPVTVSLASGEQATCDVQVWHHAPVRRRRGPRRRLLLIHGFRGDHHGLQLIVDALPEQEILVPDLPGFGSTPPLSAGDHDVEAYAGVVDSLAQELGLGDQDVLVGHSFGSIIVAAHAARRHSRPDGRRWAGVALLNPISDDMFTGTLLPGAAAVETYYRVCAVLPEPWALSLLRSRLILGVTNLSLIVSRDPEIINHVRQQHQQHFGGFSDRATLLQAYRSSTRTTVAQYAEGLTLPTLLVIGARDQLTTVHGQRRLAEQLPDRRTEVIRDVGHLLHYEKPGATARAVRRFLLDLSSLQGREVVDDDAHPR